MDDTNAEDLIERLTILGNAPQNKKMMLRNGGLEMESSEWWPVQWMCRSYYGDGKLRVTEAIRALLDRTDHILTKATEDIRSAQTEVHFVAQLHDPSSRLSRTIQYLGRLREALHGCTRGIENLEVTYRNSETVCARLKSSKRRIEKLLERCDFAATLGDPRARGALANAPISQQQRPVPRTQAVAASSPRPIPGATGAGRHNLAADGGGAETVAGTEDGSFRTAFDQFTVKLSETPMDGGPLSAPEERDQWPEFQDRGTTDELDRQSAQSAARSAIESDGGAGAHGPDDDQFPL